MGSVRKFLVDLCYSLGYWAAALTDMAHYLVSPRYRAKVDETLRQAELDVLAIVPRSQIYVFDKDGPRPIRDGEYPEFGVEDR